MSRCDFPIYRYCQIAPAYRGGSPEVTSLERAILLAHTLGKDRAWLYAHPGEIPSPAAHEEFLTQLKRKGNGEPIAYIIGHREFWSLNFTVTPTTLVPRPETEHLVERALAVASQANHVADLGTGCGAIAIALKKENPTLSVIATDISSSTLAVAEHNALRYAIDDIEWRTGHWCEALSKDKFDLIVSNPPYICCDDPLLNTALRFEPRSALASGPQGLDAIRCIANRAGAHLRARGYLLLEHGRDQGAAVRTLLQRGGFSEITTHRDLAKHERITEEFGNPHPDASCPYPLQLRVPYNSPLFYFYFKRDQSA